MLLTGSEDNGLNLMELAVWTHFAPGIVLLVYLPQWLSKTGISRSNLRTFEEKITKKELILPKNWI